MIAAYREPDTKHGKARLQAVIDSVPGGVPATPTEIGKLGRTSTNPPQTSSRFWTGPGTSNGPTEPSTAASNTSPAAPSDSRT